MSEKKIVHELELEKGMKAIITVIGETVCVELVDPSKELTCVNYFKLDAAKKLGKLLSSL
ncbi:MAG: hypothetical protein ACFFCD_02330 [Promethearchaeota archaeon]